MLGDGLVTLRLVGRCRIAFSHKMSIAKVVVTIDFVSDCSRRCISMIWHADWLCCSKIRQYKTDSRHQVVFTLLASIGGGIVAPIDYNYFNLYVPFRPCAPA